MTKKTKAYIPFGEEWKAEMKKTPKDFLIEQLRIALLENKAMQRRIESLIDMARNELN